MAIDVTPIERPSPASPVRRWSSVAAPARAEYP